jgi:hypothetical protein
LLSFAFQFIDLPAHRGKLLISLRQFQLVLFLSLPECGLANSFALLVNSTRNFDFLLFCTFFKFTLLFEMP